MQLQALHGRKLVEISQHSDHVAVDIWSEETLVDALPECRGFLQPAELHVLQIFALL